MGSHRLSWREGSSKLYYPAEGSSAEKPHTSVTPKSFLGPLQFAGLTAAASLSGEPRSGTSSTLPTGPQTRGSTLGRPGLRKGAQASTPGWAFLCLPMASGEQQEKGHFLHFLTSFGSILFLP